MKLYRARMVVEVLFAADEPDRWQARAACVEEARFGQVDSIELWPVSRGDALPVGWTLSTLVYGTKEDTTADEVLRSGER